MSIPTAKPKQIAVIAGPTGSGESTITKAIIDRCKNTARLVTATTRSPRAGEQYGQDYFFFSKEDFLQKQQAGEILEVSYIENRDTYYGTYAPDLAAKLAQGLIVLVNPDIVGAKFYKEQYSATTIFIVPGSLDELPNRLRARNPEMSEEEITKRYNNAVSEVRDEGPFYDYQVVNANGKLEDAVQATISILEKEGYNI
jgi:guanylate kinase